MSFSFPARADLHAAYRAATTDPLAGRRARADGGARARRAGPADAHLHRARRGRRASSRPRRRRGAGSRASSAGRSTACPSPSRTNTTSSATARRAAPSFLGKSRGDGRRARRASAARGGRDPLRQDQHARARACIRPGSTRGTAPRAIRTIRRATPAARRRARAPRSGSASCPSRSATTAADRSAFRRRSTASAATRPTFGRVPTDGVPPPAAGRSSTSGPLGGDRRRPRCRDGDPDRRAAGAAAAAEARARRHLLAVVELGRRARCRRSRAPPPSASSAAQIVEIALPHIELSLPVGAATFTVEAAAAMDAALDGRAAGDVDARDAGDGARR